MTPPEELAGPSAWLVDLDGTLALGHFGESGRRGPFDWKRVGEDDPNWPVVDLVKTLAQARHLIVIVTGRSHECLEESMIWLARLGVPFHAVLMRAEGDYRPDHVVKQELYENHIRGHYFVRGVLDDRDSVVALWRSLGLLCCQVAEGAF